MSSYKEKDSAELNELYLELRAEFDELKSKGYKLDMSRGKPSPAQLDMCNGLLTSLSEEDYISESGLDCRNYGGLDGLPEMKKIFADILDILPEQVIVGGNSSLNMMFDNVASNMTHGVRDSIPWVSQGKVKFLCPVPGYDRHFSICEYFHIEMIPIHTNEYGPDMDMIEKLVSEDEMIKGIWCVPKYSNPDGTTYSKETVLRFANLKPAANDFRIYWDDAYAIHPLYDEIDSLPNIIEECEKAGNPNMPLVFTSFSKISLAGSGVSCMASSVSNVEFIKKRLSIQTIGPDKLNQLRHVRFFKNIDGVKAQMAKHASILRPKFELCESILSEELGDLDISTWTKPKGGYFISFFGLEGTAKKIVQYCTECGVVLTGAGATYPYKNDPFDSNIRIAPSYPDLDELEQALKIFAIAVKLASVETLLIPKNTL